MVRVHVGSSFRSRRWPLTACLLCLPFPDVWRFDVVTDQDGKPSLQQMYVCRYSTLVPDCVWLNTTEALNPDDLSPHFRAQCTLRTLRQATTARVRLTPSRTLTPPPGVQPVCVVTVLGPKPVAGAPLKPGLQPRHYRDDGTPIIDLGDDNRATVALGPNDESVRRRHCPL